MIVFALRHADRKPDPDDDLSPAGLVRARLLARILAESGVRTVFCSSVERARKTAQPLKDRLGNRVDVVPIDVGTPTHEQQFIDGVKALPQNSIAAIIGHSNTVGPIIAGLTGQAIDPIDGHEFDKLFVLSIVANGTSTVALTRYGEPT